MDANDFVDELKAKDTAGDLVKDYDDYRSVLTKLLAKDRATFSLRVLCVLCRNLDSAPKWPDSIDNKTLLHLTIDCVRETRTMERNDRMKTLACICRIHRHVTRQNTLVQPELVLKLSFMPFELEAKHLIAENSKMYWNLLIDRLAYMERLKTKTQIIKLLPKLAEDILKLIEIYNLIQLCTSVIVYIVKKLHVLYMEKHPKELNDVFGQIFRQLSLKDAKPLKTMSEKDIIDVYVKLSDCLYVIAENASKIDFKDACLTPTVQTCIGLVGHSTELLHCIHTYHTMMINIYATDNLSYTESMLNLLLSSLENLKPGSETAMIATYPFINQLLRIYIEYNVNNCSKRKDHFSIPIQTACLKVMLILIKCLEDCEQVLKCENCHVTSGLHDSLRLSFSVKHFISVSIAQNIVITELIPILEAIIVKQYEMLTELKSQGCRNYEKFFRKLQTDVHNTAISLNKALYYEFSIKLFNVYIKHEINERNLTEQKNISRALYNKSICELNSALYQNGLVDAFLSLVFTNENTVKYMSLVIDIKAKELVARGDAEDKAGLQTLSFIDACQKALEEDLYGNIQPFFTDLEFSKLLCQEFQMYAKLWPSALPITGVWQALVKMAKGHYQFAGEQRAATLALYEVVTQTPTVVRAMTNECFDIVVTELLDGFNGRNLTPDEKVVVATLLFLKAEFDLQAASLKYGWKQPAQTIPSQDYDQIPCYRTIPQEYAASKQAVRAVAILAELSPKFNTVTNSKWLRNSLQTYTVYVQQLLHLSRDLEGLQLAYICCLIADCVGDDEAYVRNAGTLLYHGEPSRRFDVVLKRAGNKAKGLAEDSSILFICNAAIYYAKCKEIGTAVKLVQAAQVKVLLSLERNPQVTLDLPIGRLLEAQLAVSDSSDSYLADVNIVQRHYLGLPGSGGSWHTRRLHSLTLRVHITCSGLVATRAARALRVWARARAAAYPAACAAAAAHAAALAALSTDTCSLQHAQIKVDNHLKYMLGLQPSNESQPCADSTESKLARFTPKPGIETMLESMVLKHAQTSPSLPSVPAFKTPSFYHHDKNCYCYACNIPSCLILACQTSSLEASMYFRANENDIARNYFNGAIKMFHMTEERLKSMNHTCNDKFIVESTVKSNMNKLKAAKIEMLMELSYFEMRNKDYNVVNEHLVEIHELCNEVNADGHLRNEIANLMICCARLSKVKPVHNGLEAAFESLTLSPMKFANPPKTPDSKPSIPPAPPANIIVNNEELPQKRKVIKLNLDEVSDDEKEFTAAKKTKKTEFKIPVPVTKHHLEAATPRIKPRILVTQPPTETPETKKKIEFFTPNESTPDQFFTPMTSVKTYKKKSLRHNIVKNLQRDFSTPTTSKEVNETDDDSDDFVKEKSNRKPVKSLTDKDNKTHYGNDALTATKFTDTEVKDRNDTVTKTGKTSASVTKLDGTVTKHDDTVTKKDDKVINKDDTVAKKDGKVTKGGDVAKKAVISLEVPSKSTSKYRLKRVTSPGKLCTEQSETRPRRLKKAVIHDLK